MQRLLKIVHEIRSLDVSLPGRAAWPIGCRRLIRNEETGEKGEKHGIHMYDSY